MKAPIYAHEIKEYTQRLKAGDILENERANYQILIRQDGFRVFFMYGQYVHFKNEAAFIRAAIRTVKSGNPPRGLKAQA